MCVNTLVFCALQKKMGENALCDGVNSTCAVGRVPDRADYLVIDINYFPGYEKLPHYEDLMAQYLATLFPEAAATARRTLQTFVSFSQKPLGRVQSL